MKDKAGGALHFWISCQTHLCTFVNLTQMINSTAVLTKHTFTDLARPTCTSLRNPFKFSLSVNMLNPMSDPKLKSMNINQTAEPLSVFDQLVGDIYLKHFKKYHTKQQMISTKVVSQLPNLTIS